MTGNVTDDVTNDVTDDVTNNAKKATTPGSRQRIDGTLHRSMPAEISVRAADPAQKDDGLLRLRLSVSSEEPYLRSSYWDDPWVEVLGHKSGEVDLSRLNDGAPVLANHDRYSAVGNTPLAGIGAVEKAWLEDGRLMADIVISRREALADLRQDIADGLVRNVSIGYQINERMLTRAVDGQPSEYRVSNWTPFEISPVDIPADSTVGLGRADENANTARYRVVDIPEAAQSPAQNPAQNQAQNPAQNPIQSLNTESHAITHQRQMETAMPEPTIETSAATASAASAAPHVDTLHGERARMREIVALGRQHGMVEQADSAVDSGMSLDAFRAVVLQGLGDQGLRPAESPEIGMSKKDMDNYSFCRALLAAADPINAHNLAPFELECSRAAQDKRGDSRSKDRETAMTIPVDMLSRNIGANSDLAGAAQRLMAQRGGSYARDLVVGTASAGGDLRATELLSSNFIDLLRNSMIIDRMGVTWLRDLNGNVAIPRQTGGATSYWVAESGVPTESQQTVDQVTLTPKTVGAFTDYSRRLLLQSSIDIEMFVRNDLATILGLAIQQAAINGSGASNEPTGILNTSGIGAVVGGTNGLAPTYDHMVDLESAVANVNADFGSLAFLTNTKVRGKLRKTQEFASTNGTAVWRSTAERGVGEVLGYGAITSNAVPSNLVKGTSGAVASAIIFGNWADLLIGMWGGLDIMLDPYAGATSGTKRVIALQDLDIAVRHPESFASMVDALTA